MFDIICFPAYNRRIGRRMKNPLAGFVIKRSAVQLRSPAFIIKGFEASPISLSLKWGQFGASPTKILNFQTYNSLKQTKRMISILCLEILPVIYLHIVNNILFYKKTRALFKKAIIILYEYYENET